MIAVTVRYVQSRQKFTQWSPPKFNSGTSGSEAGTSYAGTSSSRPTHGTGKTGLYDRWLMVRFTLAFIILASVPFSSPLARIPSTDTSCSVFEVTNTLFQITALQNNISKYPIRATRCLVFTPVCVCDARPQKTKAGILATQTWNHHLKSIKC